MKVFLVLFRLTVLFFTVSVTTKSRFILFLFVNRALKCVCVCEQISVLLIVSLKILLPSVGTGTEKEVYKN